MRNDRNREDQEAAQVTNTCPTVRVGFESSGTQYETERRIHGGRIGSDRIRLDRAPCRTEPAKADSAPCHYLRGGPGQREPVVRVGAGLREIKFLRQSGYQGLLDGHPWLSCGSDPAERLLEEGHADRAATAG